MKFLPVVDKEILIQKIFFANRDVMLTSQCVVSSPTSLFVSIIVLSVATLLRYYTVIRYAGKDIFVYSGSCKRTTWTL